MESEIPSDFKLYMHVGMVMMIVIGIIIFIIGTAGYKHISKECDSNRMRDSLTFLIALGASLTTIGIGYWACIYSSTSCFSE